MTDGGGKGIGLEIDAQLLERLAHADRTGGRELVKLQAFSIPADLQCGKASYVTAGAGG
jgi:hypothetical protein